MKKNTFVEEMKRRGKEDENAYTMIGTELKRVRTSQRQTLSSVAGNLCSVSYLCKIEKAQLKPNRYMLNEICKRLNLDTPKLDILFDLKKLISKAVKHFYLGRMNELKKIYDSCREFDNYRTKMIILIYDIATYQFEEADAVAKELLKITGVMHDDELSIFMVFYSKLKYYEESYLEALDNIRQLSERYGLEDTLGKIASLICLECYMKIDSPMTLLHSQKLLDLFLKTAEFDQAEYVRYLQTLYMIQNAMLDCAHKELHYLQKKEYRNTAQFIYDLKARALKRQEDYTNLRPFGKLLHTYIFEKKKYLEVFCEMDKNLGFICDFSYNIANYMTLSDDVERYQELSDIIIPNIKQTNSSFERFFFLKEFCRISSNFGRYKSFCRAYQELNGGYVE